MYKVIKHSVEEHHFEHPALAEAAIRMHHTGTLSAAAINLPAGNSGAIKLRINARNYFSRFIWQLRSYLISEIDGAKDLAVAEANLSNHIAELGDLIVPFYGNAAGTELTKLLRVFVSSLTDIIKAAKANQDTAVPKAKAFNHVKDLATLLSSANPVHWPSGAVEVIFTALVNSIADEAIARHKKDLPAEQKAVAKVHELLLGDQATKVAGFADIVSKGIIDQFPDNFR